MTHFGALYVLNIFYSSKIVIYEIITNYSNPFLIYENQFVKLI